MASAREMEVDYAGEDDAVAAGERRPSDDPTGELYPEFQQAYQFFNEHLFGGRLPYVLITLQRKNSSEAYWSPSRFATVAGALTGELAMNPRYLAVRSPLEILSVLVHEQVHVWQTYFGKPGRRGYHNRQWADKMKEVGLYPSSTDAIGGDETGEQVGHYIIDGGLFETTANALIGSGFVLTWYDRFPARQAKPIGRSSDTPPAQGAVTAMESSSTVTALTAGSSAQSSIRVELEDGVEQALGQETLDGKPAPVSISALLQRPQGAGTPAALYPALQLQMPAPEDLQATRNRVKFQCLKCKQAAWGKPSLQISCTPCEARMQSIGPATLEGL